MKRLLIICAAVLLAGCGSMKLGSFAYCAHNVPCEFSSGSAPK